VVYRPFGAFRLLLALLVMCQHFFADLAPASLAEASAPFAFGGMAVLVFFALSGFVISEAIDRIYHRRAKAFLENRLLRIMPHFIVAVALSMLFHGLFHQVGGVHLWRSQPDFPENAFAVKNVLLNFVGVAPLADRVITYNFLDITWAVRVEMAFYLLAALCIRGSGSRSYIQVAGWAALGLAPLFLLAVAGRGIAMFSYLPFFVYGCALYFALSGNRGCWLISLICVPAMLFQCAWATGIGLPGGIFPRPVIGNVSALAILLAVMTILSIAHIRQFRALDRSLGDLTYPLYLYHEVVLIAALTFFPAYSYGLLFSAMVISLGFAALMAKLVDPLVAYYRNLVRGVALPVIHSDPPMLRPSGSALPELSMLRPRSQR
jgi:peptidoglycan/LPS O-acetylase OafA/YrhL